VRWHRQYLSDCEKEKKKKEKKEKKEKSGAQEILRLKAAVVLWGKKRPRS